MRREEEGAPGGVEEPCARDGSQLVNSISLELIVRAFRMALTFFLIHSATMIQRLTMYWTNKKRNRKTKMGDSRTESKLIRCTTKIKLSYWLIFSINFVKFSYTI